MSVLEKKLLIPCKIYTGEYLIKYTAFQKRRIFLWNINQVLNFLLTF